MKVFNRNLRALLSTVLALSIMSGGAVPVFAEHMAAIEPNAAEATAEAPIPVTTGPLQVIVNRIPLTAKLLQERYTGVQLQITNPTNQPITLTSAEIENAVNGSAAYEDTHKSLLGWTSFLGVTGLVFSTIRRSSRNSKARNESQHFENSQLTGIIQPGQTVEALSLLPIEHPVVSVNVRFQDPNTGEDKTQNHLF